VFQIIIITTKIINPSWQLYNFVIPVTVHIACAHSIITKHGKLNRFPDPFLIGLGKLFSVLHLEL